MAVAAPPLRGHLRFGAIARLGTMLLRAADYPPRAQEANLGFGAVVRIFYVMAHLPTG